MYEIFESLNDNAKIEYYFNNLDNYKAEKLMGGGTVGSSLHLMGSTFRQKYKNLRNR